MQVEASLPGTSTVIAQSLLQMNMMNNMKSVTLKIKVKVMEHNIHNGVMLWQISKYIKVVKHFCAGFHHFRDFSISHFHVENVGQEGPVRHSQ